MGNGRKQLWAKAHPDRVKASMDKYVRNGGRRRSRLLKRYGIDLDILNLLKKAQENKCAICQREKRLVVDHDHTNNKVRALLCDRCNLGLGCFGDDSSLLAAALDYLILWEVLHGKGC